MPCSKESALDLLLGAHRAGRLGHAHLFTGAAGSGKTWLARRLAAEVLGCTHESVPAHPDAHFVQPESKSRRILIDQIRAMDTAIHRKPLLGPTKVAIITDADRLHPAAANAFLKTLEEPPEGSLMLLTTTLREAMLETILSRCMETALDAGEHPLDAASQELIEALEACLLAPGGPAIAGAFRVARTVQALLNAIRERAGAEHAAILKQESARYKHMADTADWLEEREEQLKAMTESAVLRERDLLLVAVLVALGGALRVAAGGKAPHPACARLAAAFPPAELFARIEAYETMRRRLALTINEALALEAGFLGIALGHPGGARRSSRP